MLPLPMSESDPALPTTFTLGEAAKAAGVSKPSISKALQNGRLSAEKKGDGSYCIHAAELFRVYPPNRQPEARIGGGETPNANSSLSTEVNQLHERLAEGGRERQQLTEQIEDLRRRLDRSEQERREKDQRLTALLTDQREKPAPEPPPLTPSPAPTAKAPKGLRGWLHRLTG